jgi:hypothetical protein
LHSCQSFTPARRNFLKRGTSRLRGCATEPINATVRVVDYVDRNVPVLARMWERRRRGYRTLDDTETDPFSMVTGTLLAESLLE